MRHGLDRHQYGYPTTIGRVSGRRRFDAFARSVRGSAEAALVRRMMARKYAAEAAMGNCARR